MTNNAFLINLDRSPQRLTFMQEQADKVGLVFERIAGVDGFKAVPEWMVDEFRHSPLSSGEIGCYASHLICAKLIVEREMPFGVILEDDSALDDDFVSTALKAAHGAPVGWDYIHLSTVYKRPVVQVSDINGRMLVKHTRLPVNTAAYVLSNAGARKLLRPRKRVRPVDMEVRYGWLDDLQIYGVFPAAATLSDAFQSDIGVTHDPGTRDRRNWSPGLLSEVRGQLWNWRRVGMGTLVKARSLSLIDSINRHFTGKRHVRVIE